MQRGHVLVVGESLVDVVVGPDGSVLRQTPGGAPLNVAVGLARLDVSTQLLSWYADDGYGAMVAAHLAEAGVVVRAGSNAAAATPVARIHLDAEHNAAYEFNLTWDPPRVPLDGCTSMHVGSLGTVVAPGADTVRTLALEAIDAGLLVSYDPNVRPALSPGPVAAWESVRRDAALAGLVKLSDDDAAYLLPGQPPDTVLDTLLAAERTRLAIITRAAAGARLATRRHRVDVGVSPVAVLDTVGAGDSYMAGLLAALHERACLSGVRLDDLTSDQLCEVGTAAAAAAAITCSRPGADPPRREELADPARP